MTVENSELERRVEHFKSVVKDAGIKLTHQRLEIFREVASSEDHPDAETVFNAVRTRMPTVSLDTVYRALRLLNDLGLVGTLGPRQEAVRFDANLTHHHHFICVRCGLARDFESTALDNIPIPDAAKQFGRVETTHVDIRGICKQCLETSR